VDLAAEKECLAYGATGLRVFRCRTVWDRLIVLDRTGIGGKSVASLVD